MARFLITGLFLLAPLVLAACGGGDDGAPADGVAHAGPATGTEAPATFGQRGAAPDSESESDSDSETGPEQRTLRVAIVDRGLQMAQGTYTIPAGWRVVQDVATDPNTGQPARYQLDIRGPDGELIRGLRPATYGPMTGAGFAQTWRDLAMRGARGEVRDVSIGTLQRSERLERLRPFRRAAAKAQQMGFRVEGLEAPLRAQSDLGPVEGAVHVLHWTSPQTAGMGVVLASVILSPADRVTETLRLNARLANAFEPNPAFEQRMEQINQTVAQRQATQHQQRMAQRQAAFNAHQQRMANRQAAFDAHQQRMQTLSGIQDQQFQTWQSAQRSNDEMQRRAVNGIHGTVDVYNNQTGETAYGVDGGYDAYWTDPSGTVVGTEGYENPDALRYEQGTDLDDVYDSSDGGSGYDDW